MQVTNYTSLQIFYRKCDSICPNEHGCLIWPGNYKKRKIDTRPNYVTIRIGFAPYKNRKRCAVHRLALERKLGRPIKSGYMALHHCDVSVCVNQEHLYEGRAKDNTDDHIRRHGHPTKGKGK